MGFMNVGFGDLILLWGRDADAKCFCPLSWPVTPWLRYACVILRITI